MSTWRRAASGAWYLARGGVSAIVGNLGLALLAFALAITLWLFVTDKENPTEAQTFNSNILIEPVNVPEALAVASVGAAGVRIRIEAPQSELDGLRAEDFEALIDLGGYTPGTHSVPIDVTPPNSRINVVSVTPARTDVLLENRRSKEVPVRVDSVGSPVTGFAVTEERADPATVTVTGAESLVALVDSAVAVVNLTGQRVDVVEDRVDLEPRDASDGGISRVTVSPDTASVTVELDQREYSLSFAVNPVITGQPASGYNVAGVSVDPRLVTVTGPLDQLQSIDAVAGLSTEEISIADARDDVLSAVQIQLPQGVRVDGGTTVNVIVDIAPARGEFSFRIAPDIRNVGEGLVAAPAGPVTVTLAGDVPALESVSAESIEAFVDAQDLGAGLYVLPVTATPPPGTQIVSIDPGEMGVGITLAP
jgi:YbbR domain-containing protein